MVGFHVIGILFVQILLNNNEYFSLLFLIKKEGKEWSLGLREEERE
jgi:hypothetical protein